LVPNEPYSITKTIPSQFSEDIVAGEPGRAHLLQAFNIARSIDLERMQQMLETSKTKILEKSKRSMVIQLLEEKSQKDSWFLTISSFGSVCFFDCKDERVQRQWLQNLQKIANTPQPEKYDNLPIVVDPNLQDWCKLEKDHFMVKKMDVHSLNIISSILSRSVALKSFEDNVHIILDEFQKLNQKVQTYKKISRREEQIFIPLIAQGNALKCDLLLNVRLLERPEISWNYEQYDRIYGLLSGEFEIDERFDSLDKKLDFIQGNTQFYMELQHSVKSERSEWLIILLILTEVILAIFLRH
jgi:uncharacterized Rmd1/YagE family protein